MPLLKADLHIHTSEDPEDYIKYSSKDIIDLAHKLGYSVLSITNHNAVTYGERLKDYARERGIILIPGVEATIQGRHVLVYNADFSLIKRRDIRSLRDIKDTESLIVAPHPYFPSMCALRGLLRPYIDLFDAIEYCHFYTEGINFNSLAERVATEHNLPMLGTSDAHQRCQFHTTYSMIDAEPDPVSVIQAIKAGKVEIKSSPLVFKDILKIHHKMLWRNLIYRIFPNLHGKSERSFAETIIIK